MLNIKFTLVFLIQSLKFSFHSVIHGLSYSLKDILESKSKFTQHHALLSQRQHCQHHCFITRDLIQVFFQILASYRYQFEKMFVDKNSFKKIIFTVFIQMRWRQIKWKESPSVCKFWIQNLIAFDAVAETIVDWWQWNFQRMWEKY